LLFFVVVLGRYRIVQTKAAATVPSPKAGSVPRFEIKKWNAVAMWSWDICADTVRFMFACLRLCLRFVYMCGTTKSILYTTCSCSSLTHTSFLGFAACLVPPFSPPFSPPCTLTLRLYFFFFFESAPFVAIP
jgi:hypothetical protein